MRHDLLTEWHAIESKLLPQLQSVHVEQHCTGRRHTLYMGRLWHHTHSSYSLIACAGCVFLSIDL